MPWPSASEVAAPSRRVPYTIPASGSQYLPPQQSRKHNSCLLGSSTSPPLTWAASQVAIPHDRLARPSADRRPVPPLKLERDPEEAGGKHLLRREQAMRQAGEREYMLRLRQQIAERTRDYNRMPRGREHQSDYFESGEGSQNMISKGGERQTHFLSWPERMWGRALRESPMHCGRALRERGGPGVHEPNASAFHPSRPSTEGVVHANGHVAKPKADTVVRI